ncbi:MAG: thymidylate synthase [Phycisphaerales bacterium]
MYIVDDTLDDLLRRVLVRIFARGERIVASRGTNLELCGVLLQLRNPRARLSRSADRGRIFSGLGELLWYLSKSDRLDFIKYYIAKYEEESDDGVTLYGAYGPRLFLKGGWNQFDAVRTLLTSKPTTRRAVIQLFDSSDLKPPAKKEIPCTCTLQFLVRQGQLDLVATMRSNDAYIGLPHDVFTFTMLQELMARTLGHEIGVYRHFIASLHIYDRDWQKARAYVRQGWQPVAGAAMPPMPLGDPWPAVSRLLAAEESIRANTFDWAADLGESDYWADLIRLLGVLSAFKRREKSQMQDLRKAMKSKVYDMYIARRQAAAASKEAEQGEFNFQNQKPPIE